MIKTLSHKKGRISYSIYGTGRPILLVHGFAEDSEIWKNQVNHLSENYRLIVPDLAGSGKSDFIPEIFTMDDHAEMLEHLLRQEKIPSVTIIGHSMGGYIALAFAEKYPTLVKALGLFHSSSAADTEEKKESRRKAIQFIKQNGSKKFLQQTTGNLLSPDSKQKTPGIVQELVDQYSNFNPNSLVHYYEAMIQRPDRSEVLRKIAKPVLIIAGEHDQAIPVKLSQEQSFLPELCYFHSLKNSGHLGMLEQPSESNAILEKFFEES